jgi:hypothetical protein
VKPRTDSLEQAPPSLDFTRTLYDQYGNLLLGYLTQITADRAQAEYYLVEIFRQVNRYADELTQPGVNVWVRLRYIARHIVQTNNLNLLSANHSLLEQNQFVEAMTAEQRHVFCGLYYQYKSIAALAQELKQDEGAVKRILKEAFNVIRNGRQG